jgi:Sap, sulfolipid-1-addressing protein
VLLNLFLISVAIAVDPLPLSAFFVILPSKSGLRKGAAFIFGWLVSLAIVVGITVAATGNNPPRPKTVPSLIGLLVRAVIGAALVVIAVRHRRKMALPKKPKKPPKWQAGVDNMSPWFAMALAPALQPWGLIAAGAATVTQARVSSFASGVALFLFCLIASSSYLAMELYATFRPTQSDVLLARVRRVIEDHTDQVIIVGSLAFGLWLIGNSIYVALSAH